MFKNILFTLSVTTILCTVTLAQGTTGYPVSFNTLQGVSDNGGILTKIAPEGWGDGASSSNQLEANTNGWLEFQPVEANNHYMLGFSESAFGFDAYGVEYGFYLHSSTEGRNLFRVPGLVNIGIWQAGDNLHVSREGNQIKYYKNGSFIWAETVNAATTLRVKSSIYRGSSPLVTASFTSVLTVQASIAPEENGVGSIQLVPSGGTPPYQYQWSGGEHTSSINKPKGLYTVTITDAANQTLSKSYNIGNKVEWSNLNAATDNSGALARTGTESWGAGGSSDNLVSPTVDGWLEFQPVEGNNHYKLGFGQAADDFSVGSVEYGFYLHSNTEGRKLFRVPGLVNLGLWQTGDILRVSRQANQMKYYKNGLLLWTETVNATNTLRVKSAIYRGGSPVVSASFMAAKALDKIDATPVKSLFNGLIASTRWRTDKAFMATGTDFSGMYAYSYDDKYQIADARWGDVNNTLGTYTLAGNKYRLTGMSYDPNGNIISLKRYDNEAQRTNNFTYHYAANKNQLHDVTGYTNVYTYNAIGQMIGEDKVEEGKDQYIEYDVSGKVTKVYSAKNVTTGAFENLKVEFQYDDRGFRLAKINYETKRETWYIRDGSGNVLSIYEYDKSNADNTKWTLTQTEVPIYGAGKLGTQYPQDDFTNYEITDHLGNVRALVREETFDETATMETARAEHENGKFLRYENVRKIYSPLFDHTNNAPPSTPDSGGKPGSTTQGYAIRLRGGAMEKRGLAKSFAIAPGDVIHMEVYAKYLDVNSNNWRAALNTLITQIAAGTAAPGTVVDGKDYNTNGSTPLPHDGLLDVPNGLGPKAYLGWLLFDKDFVHIDGGFKRMSDFAKENGDDVDHEKLEADLHITQPGYIYIYLSNDEETPVEVYMDDFTVTHNGSYVSQATDYGVWGDVLREQKATLDQNYKYRFGYQGKYAEKDEETGWSHFELREYDAVIGRWTSKDPKGQFFSPYVGMGNNPISGLDPDGAWLFDLFGSTSAQRQAARADANAFEGAHINNFFSKDINVTWEGSYLESPQPHLWSEKNLYKFSYDKDGSPGDLGLSTLYTSFSGIAEFDPLGQITFTPGAGAIVGIPLKAVTAPLRNYAARTLGASLVTSEYLGAGSYLFGWGNKGGLFKGIYNFSTKGVLNNGNWIRVGWQMTSNQTLRFGLRFGEGTKQFGLLPWWQQPLNSAIRGHIDLLYHKF